MTHSFLAKAALAAVASIITLTPALADRGDKRQHTQTYRMEQGVKSAHYSKHKAQKPRVEHKRAYFKYKQNRAHRGHGWYKPWKRHWGWGYGRSYQPHWR